MNIIDEHVRSTNESKVIRKCGAGSNHFSPRLQPLRMNLERWLEVAAIPLIIYLL